MILRKRKKKIEAYLDKDVAQPPALVYKSRGASHKIIQWGNKSYIVNTNHIESFDNNDIFIKTYEIAIGNSYRDEFFEEFVVKQMR